MNLAADGISNVMWVHRFKWIEGWEGKESTSYGSNYWCFGVPALRAAAATMSDARAVCKCCELGARNIQIYLDNEHDRRIECSALFVLAIGGCFGVLLCRPNSFFSSPRVLLA